MNDFASRLIAWQREHGRHDLPWQGGTDPYPIWLSEIMLQQTQVDTVIPYYLRFRERFRDVGARAARRAGGWRRRSCRGCSCGFCRHPGVRARRWWRLQG